MNSISRHKLGGGEKWMIKAARGLSGRGHEIWIGGKQGSEFLARALGEGLQTKEFNVRMDFSPLNTYLIARFLKKTRIDVLICNLNKDVRVAGLAARFVDTPAVIARHGILLCGKKWRHKITLTRLVHGILTNTESIKEAYSSYGWFGPEFVQVIYNGIESDPSVEPFDFHSKLPGKKVILAAGRLSEQKGFRYLVEAARLLHDKRSDLHFVVLGRGRLEEEIRQMIRTRKLEESFSLWGYHDDIKAYMFGCDLFVLSSIFEGMPNVVMEAMASGKPVVATDVNGVRELMIDRVTGLIVPPKDPVSLASAIDGLISDGNRMQEFGIQGKARVEQYFTRSGMIDNLEAYFRAKCNGPRPEWQ